MKTLAAIAVLCALTTAAGADAPDPKRRVAVLEFRSGSAELTGIDARLAAQLGKSTSLTIVDGDAARRAYGGTLDRDLVACAGAGSCVARVGKKLGVVEVLLVGVSEFGDVILTLQRIDVRRGRVVNRVAEALEPGAAPDDVAVGRYLKRLMPTSDFIRWGEIRIDANVDGADVMVNNMPRGRTPLPPLRLRAPASYDIKVSKPGYVPFGANVHVPADGSMRVKAALGRRSDPAWYSRWWVAAIAGTVVVGGTAAIFVATRDAPSDVPTVVVFPAAD
jgi:hypothetical protein